MIAQGIHSVTGAPVVAKSLECLAHATNNAFEYSIDGLVVGVALGVLVGYAVLCKDSKDPNNKGWVGIDPSSVKAVFAFGVTLVTCTTAWATYGAAKSVFGF